MTLGWWPQTWKSQFSCLEIGDETLIHQGILWMMGGKSQRGWGQAAWRGLGSSQHISNKPLLTRPLVPLFEVSSSWFLLTLEWSACL